MRDYALTWRKSLLHKQARLKRNLNMTVMELFGKIGLFPIRLSSGHTWCPAGCYPGIHVVVAAENQKLTKGIQMSETCEI